jgi:hypothetical protein
MPVVYQDDVAVVVVLETLALGLLGVLVAGLLRSHAEILRQLHHLGAGPSGPAASVEPPMTLAPIRGVTTAGDAITIAVGRPREPTLLVFLSTGCHRCGAFWSALHSPDLAPLGPGTRVVVITRDESEESPARVAALAPEHVPVVMSSRAWDDYRVPGSPYAVYLDGQGVVAGRGTAPSWPQLVSLVTQAEQDRDNPRRVDRELQAAGLLPGDASLYPTPGSLSRA